MDHENYNESSLIQEHCDALQAYWRLNRDELIECRDSYQWPRGTRTDESLKMREALETEIQQELKGREGLSKVIFDKVIRWGFGTNSECTEEQVRRATRDSFRHLDASEIAEAAMVLVQLPGIGISRATKILALSNQSCYGIYDSRSAHGLSDLVDKDGARLIAIPPGRVIKGDALSKDRYCHAFARYTWVLRYLVLLAGRDAASGKFSRVADLEMALFMKSRRQTATQEKPHSPALPHLHELSELDEENLYWTLGPGGKSKPFWAIEEGDEVTVFTGQGKTTMTLSTTEVNKCLSHFVGEIFPLSNSKTASERRSGGLGEYFMQNFGSPVFASHFAALWVHKGRLKATRDSEGKGWWLLVRDNIP